MYSYAFAVLPLSAYMAWHRLRRAPVERSMPDYVGGVAVMLFAVVTLAAGEVGSILLLQEISLLAAVLGLVLLFFGRRVAVVFWIPLAYLAFMVPIWDFVIANLHASSQLASAKLATAVLHGMGIPALQTQTLIVLPNITLEVARECSGVHQLVAVLAVAIPVSYTMLTGAPRRIFLVGFALLVALVSNGLRIALIGAWTYNGWPDGDVHGPFHVLQGLAVSAVGYVVIFLTVSALSRAETSSPQESRGSRPLRALLDLMAVERRPAVDSVFVLMAMVPIAAQFWTHPAETPLLSSLRQFPSHVAGWTADVTARHSTHDFRLRGVDEELARTYVNAQGRRVRLYVGYLRRQQQGRELVGDTTLSLVDTASNAHVVVNQPAGATLNHIVRREAGKPRETVFWYDLNGRLVANAYAAKAYSVQDAVTRQRTNGALVVVDWETPAEGHVGSDARQEWEFVHAVIPLLRQYIPS